LAKFSCLRVHLYALFVWSFDSCSAHVFVMDAHSMDLEANADSQTRLKHFPYMQDCRKQKTFTRKERQSMTKWKRLEKKKNVFFRMLQTLNEVSTWARVTVAIVQERASMCRSGGVKVEIWPHSPLVIWHLVCLVGRKGDAMLKSATVKQPLQSPNRICKNSLGFFGNGLYVENELSCQNGPGLASGRFSLKYR
jgi:hypothetical protein